VWPVDHVTGAVIENCHAYTDRAVGEKESVSRSAATSAAQEVDRLLTPLTGLGAGDAVDGYGPRGRLARSDRCRDAHDHAY
jgi:hypothetical protein